MSSVSRYGTIAVLLLATVARPDAPAKPPSTEDGRIVHLKDVQWTPAKMKEFPPGAMSSVIAVDPQTGGSIAYGKFPAGGALATHWHSFAEYTVLLSGKATFTVDGKATELSPGDFIVIPAKVLHSLKCGAGAECVVFTRRGGATDYHFES
jgi:quercetin dioxygenase-like cupin family protein